MEIPSSKSHDNPIYVHRLKRDQLDLSKHDFDTGSSFLDAVCSENAMRLIICIKEGSYRNGHFEFHVNIPSNYPFKMPDVWACHPIWHPNIDLHSGRVFLPLEWSPVLTLTSIAVAVQMIMLEPSTLGSFNSDSLSLYCSNFKSYEDNVQQTIKGGHYVGTDFATICKPCHHCRIRNKSTTVEKACFLGNKQPLEIDAKVGGIQLFPCHNTHSDCCPDYKKRRSHAIEKNIEIFHEKISSVKVQEDDYDTKTILKGDEICGETREAACKRRKCVHSGLKSITSHDEEFEEHGVDFHHLSLSQQQHNYSDAITRYGFDYLHFVATQSYS